MRMTPLHTVLGLALVGALAVACDTEQPTTVDAALGHDHSPVQAFAPGSSQSAAHNELLRELRGLTANWHTLEQAEKDGYTVAAGCIDERVMGVDPSDARGMGYHYLNPALIDEHVNIHEPELIVYAMNPTTGRHELAGFDYFVLGSILDENGPAPSLMGVEFTWSPMAAGGIGGWMLHTWPWLDNPDGFFENFNEAVPLCGCDPTDGGAGACFPAE